MFRKKQSKKNIEKPKRSFNVVRHEIKDIVSKINEKNQRKDFTFKLEKDIKESEKEYIFLFKYTDKVKIPGFKKEIFENFAIIYSKDDTFDVSSGSGFFEDGVKNKDEVQKFFEQRIEGFKYRKQKELDRLKSTKELLIQGRIKPIDPKDYTLDELQYLSK